MALFFSKKLQDIFYFYGRTWRNVFFIVIYDVVVSMNYDLAEKNFG